jgi:FixJ family two-component response regulator
VTHRLIAEVDDDESVRSATVNLLTPVGFFREAFGPA